MEHERHILQHNPRHSSFIEQPKDVTNERRSGSTDACCHPCLTQILARETTDDRLDFVWQGSQLDYVALESDIREPIREYRPGGFPNLAKHNCLVAGRRKAKLQAADSGK
jgi:hypothetical protein